MQTISNRNKILGISISYSRRVRTYRLAAQRSLNITSMDDFQEQQAMEIEALESILMDDLQGEFAQYNHRRTCWLIVRLFMHYVHLFLY